MTDYKSMYLKLFNAITDAIKELEMGSRKNAAAVLKTAQAECEEIYLQAED